MNYDVVGVGVTILNVLEHFPHYSAKVLLRVPYAPLHSYGAVQTPSGDDDGAHLGVKVLATLMKT